jgi:Tol biopolymer transport system component
MMGYPAWAVDGGSVVYKLYDQQGWIGTGQYDLAADSWRLIHEYRMAGGTEPWAQFAFSPDGRWLAMVNQSDPLTLRYGPAVWVLPLAGGDPILLGAGTSPVWSPDSTRLVFTQSSGGAFDQDFLQLVLAESWEPVQLEDMPGGYYPQSWQ